MRHRPSKAGSAYGRHVEIRTILAGRAQRRTVGFYDEYENAPPFDGDGKPALQADQTIAVQWRSLDANADELTTTRNVRVLHIMYARSAAAAPDGPRPMPASDKLTSRVTYAARQAHSLSVL